MRTTTKGAFLLTDEMKLLGQKFEKNEIITALQAGYNKPSKATIYEYLNGIDNKKLLSQEEAAELGSMTMMNSGPSFAGEETDNALTILRGKWSLKSPSPT